jgi:tRNA-2-methylthio-N6-dimethylallyladenosine synthase
MKNAALLTYGCQMNKNDTETIAGILEADNYHIVEDLSLADVILLNTCSIRDKAEQKVYSDIGRLRQFKEKKPELIIGIGGCVGQLQGKRILKRVPLVDLVFGTSNAHKLPKLLKEIKENGKRIADTEKSSEWSDAVIPKRDGKVSAWVTIMRGCSNYCAYCVVPYARGKEISRRENEIFDEVSKLIENGYKEVTLLGQNVNSFGNDLEGGTSGFHGLLEKINFIQGLERLRFVTSHPKDFSINLMDAMNGLEKVCESIHLPVQAGSDEVLKMMNRGYTCGQYLDTLNEARRRVEDLAVTSDVIVGFPGETEKDFLKTIDLVKGARFDNLYLFKYSIRAETPAASYENQVSEIEKQRRFEEVLKVQDEITLSINGGYVGKKAEVLVEGMSKKDNKKYSGRTRSNKVVNFSSNAQLEIGTLINVEILEGKIYGLEGTYG